ncbi:hypothetical protein K438DRAFT_1792942 [Mycena galopus ATCC 62051]|nr:hypothetical protein K438DRAFT_1792942 [Mycena galopus ATCC 62051]
MSRLIAGLHSQSDEIMAEIFREHVKWETEEITATSCGPWVLSYRSQHYPLEIRLDFHGMGTDPSVAALTRSMGITDPGAETLRKQLLSAVVAHSDRWKVAELRISSAAIPYFASIHNHLPILADLTIVMFASAVSTIQRFPYTQNAPCLTNITLYDYPHEYIDLPWSSTRSFSERSLFPRSHSPTDAAGSYLKLLRNNPNLEYLDVTYPLSSPSRSPLTHFSLQCIFANEGNLMRSLTLPNLQQVVVQPKPGTMPALRDLLARSKCSLKCLHFVEFTLDEDALAIFAGSTSLHTLMLRITRWDAAAKKTMKLLVKKLEDASFLSHLENLDIIIRDECFPEPKERPFKMGFIGDLFVEMLGARWERRRVCEGKHLQRIFVLVDLPSTVRDPHALDSDLTDARFISYVYDT